MASNFQNYDLVQTYQDEDFKALRKEERDQLSREEYEILKNAGFHFNYENGVNSFVSVKSSQDHTVMFDPPTNEKEEKDQWNNNYVKLPFSEYNRDKNGQSRWPVIKKSLNRLAQLMQTDPDCTHIEEQMKNYRRSKYFNCGCLNYIFQEELEGKKGETLLKEVIPKIVELALDLPNLIRKPIPMLKSGKTHSISLTQHQCASLLANSFFCTFPDRGNDNPENMPYINMDGLHNGSGMKFKVEKLKCILHYFQRVTNKMPEGVLTFSRICIPESNFPSFRNSNKPIRKPVVRVDGTIEDCKGALQVDFANKYIGGGVLNHGCVQEEIRFVICPELLVSLLFCERMDSNEAILIRGAERFSSYTGYARSFEWLEDYDDDTARDEYKRRYTDIVAIDALKYRYLKVQFEENNINRELRKSYTGFASQVLGQRFPLIATGNWGCGAFGGDKQLKFLIQLMSASQADRDLVYYTFNDKNTLNALNELCEIIEKKSLTVSELYKRIVHYYDEIVNISSRNLGAFNLLEYLKTIYSKKDCACS